MYEEPGQGRFNREYLIDFKQQNDHDGSLYLFVN